MYSRWIEAHSSYTVRCGNEIHGTYDDFREAKIKQIALLTDLDLDAEIEHDTWYLPEKMPSVEEQLDAMLSGGNNHA